jgi:hypothetical protein
MSLLDPRFKYVSAAETDITATWRRHGFDARRNAERRARLQQHVAHAEAGAISAPVYALVRRTA